MALTPMMRQYMEVKERYADCILFFTTTSTPIASIFSCKAIARISLPENTFINPMIFIFID